MSEQLSIKYETVSPLKIFRSVALPLCILLIAFIFLSQFSGVGEELTDSSTIVMEGSDSGRTGNYSSPPISTKPVRAWFHNSETPVLAGISANGNNIFFTSYPSVMEAKSKITSLAFGSGDMTWTESVPGHAIFPAFFSIDGAFLLTQGYEKFYDHNTKSTGDIPGKILELEPKSGTVVSSKNISFSTVSPLVTDDSIIVCDGSEIICIDKFSFEENWKFPSSFAEETTNEFVVMPSLDLVNHIVVTGNDAREVFGFSISTGKVVWMYKAPGKLLGFSCSYQGKFFLSTSNGQALCINSLDGKLLWKANRHRFVSAGFGIYKDSLIVCEGNRLSALSIDNGRERFSVESAGKIVGFPSLTGDIAYVGTDIGYIYAIDCKKKSVIWRYLLFSPIVGSPIPYRGAIYVADRKSIIYCLKQPDEKAKK